MFPCVDVIGNILEGAAHSTDVSFGIVFSLTGAAHPDAPAGGSNFWHNLTEGFTPFCAGIKDASKAVAIFRQVKVDGFLQCGLKVRPDIVNVGGLY